MRSGRVAVGGEIVTDPARDVTAADVVTVDGKPLQQSPERVVYAVNKPLGVVSTASDPQGRRTIVSLLDDQRRLYPVGRLDIDTTGLILLTNDGDLAYRLTHPSFEVPKTYRATVTRPPVRRAAIEALTNGIELDDGLTAPATVRRLAPDTLELTIHEGRKRQVRRMCELVGHPVKRLERVAFGLLRLGSLPSGGHRELTPAEVEALLASGAGATSAPAGRRRSSRSSSARPRSSAE